MSSTKKVKSAGRFGSRYGVGIRKRLLKVEQRQHEDSECPSCGYKKIRREAAGIFDCKKCGGRFTGGAYFPQTLTGRIVAKMVSQKSFLPNLGELLSTQVTETGENEESPSSESENKKK
ncbi:MAG: 50S ribosomal protein L37ae [Candidatus Diapherotrites archaeon]|uniref:Large ribosomal subunit protein eL43 n=1 Tax=Candidatus Iainarchaeum sp. TaxID=3101447 RepID=A0A8T4LAT8_9ARCH|nr:50S ribosomal protein L37ae [Candidatus Diapherotrites archaeon]